MLIQNQDARGSCRKTVLVVLCLMVLSSKSSAICLHCADDGLTGRDLGTSDDSRDSKVTETKSLYVRIHFRNAIKTSALKRGSVLQGTLEEPVYSGERELFPAGSDVQLTVDRLERGPKTINDHWPWVIKAFSPRHEMRPVFSSATVALNTGETVPLKVSLISLADKKEARIQWKTNKTGDSSKTDSPPNSALASPPDLAHPIKAPRQQTHPRGTTVIFEAVALPNGAGEQATKSDTVEALFAETAAIGAGMEVRAILLSAVSASSNRRGDNVTARVVEPVRISPAVVLPEGTLIEGKVQKVTRPRWLSRSGSLLVNFDRLILPDGLAVPIKASVVGAELDSASRTQIDPEGELVGDKPGRAWMLINLGAAMGLTKVADDSTQLVIEAIVSTATDVSTAGVARIVGFGVSGVFMITRRGRDVLLPKYTELRIALDEPAYIPLR